jgi:glutamate--cysteine ligase
MEEHFRAVGCGQAGRSMMCSTAALQVNLEAGPAAQWPDRVSLMHRLGPVLVALAACSPMLDGRSTGWASTRQRVWGEIDQRRCGPLLSGQHPDAEWADYALSAPVMLLRDPRSGEAAPVLGRVSFDAWLTGESPLGGRRPTLADLDYHLTTLFPPVRPRGFLEIRYLDALPGAYWPALAAIVVTLLDDPRAAGVAAEACEPVEEAWTRAARHGLDDPVLRRAACRCVATAATYAPPALHDAVQRFAELVMDGRSPGGEFAERLRSVGPVRALREAADE